MLWLIWIIQILERILYERIVFTLDFLLRWIILRWFAQQLSRCAGAWLGQCLLDPVVIAVDIDWLATERVLLQLMLWRSLLSTYASNILAVSIVQIIGVYFLMSWHWSFLLSYFRDINFLIFLHSNRFVRWVNSIF